MIRVLIVDDQIVVRNILEEALTKNPFIEVAGKASNALEAKKLVPILKPDLITLDVEMPGMNGLEFLDWLMPIYPTPVIMLSSHTKKGAEITLDALQKGAMDFIEKADGTEKDFIRMIEELIDKIKKLGKVKIGSKSLFSNSEKNQESNRIQLKEKKGIIQLIAIGASTGGTQALDYIMNRLPNNLPPIVIVQHMPEHFTKLFANRLAATSGLNIKEADNGDILEIGGVYVAPGNKHMLIRKMAGKLFIEIEFFDKVSGHRPSVDALFESIAKSSFAASTLSMLLTGMGKDGANGLLSLKNAGSHTLGQDEFSSTVYGMPREAYLLGAVKKQVSLENIPKEILSLV
jgi:two-component system chemotaxis response regulator CheB